MLSESRLGPDDIESGWSGLRPLVREEGKGPSEISRKDEMFISDSGLITIAGGKLTGFRKMAEKVVNLRPDSFKTPMAPSILLVRRIGFPSAGAT